MFAALIKALASELESRAIPYMIFGGQAVLQYGEPRLTRDIDLTIGLAPSDCKPILDLIEQLKLKILVDNPQDFLRETFVLPALDSESGLRVDFVFALSEFENAAIARASQLEVDGYQVRFITAPDLVILKTIAGRPRDLEDIRGVLLKTKDLDIVHVRKWLSEFDRELGEGYLKRFEDILKTTLSASNQ